MTTIRAPVAQPTREWVTIADPDAAARRRFTFDVSFLLSSWTCIYGTGCHGIESPLGSRASAGCCTHGAWLTEEEDPRTLESTVRDDLSPATMTHHEEALARGVLTTDDDGGTHTRLVDGVCIFHNPAEDDAPTGCALHHLATSTGVSPVSTKPTVCWQLPLHRTIDEHVADDGGVVEEHRIEAFERGHWGEGGADFGWYCLDDEQAFVGRRAVYRAMELELRAMVGDPVYDALARHLDGRRRQRNVPRYLPVT